jgi:prephenate dehydrogenase
MRVAIVGTGLVGGSLGLALARLDDVERIVGYDHDGEQLATALARGAVSETAGSIAEAAEGAELVIVAVPTSATASVAAEVGPTLEPGAILTDVASVKSGVVEALQASARAEVHVIGGHPMAGSHEHGAAHASVELFLGASYLLTPTTHTDPQAYRVLHRLVSRIGARPLAVDPAHHDALAAVVSHLPQLAATTLMNLAAERARDDHAGLLLLAAGGFRDATRVAASDPELWLDICTQNRDAIVAVLDEYTERLTTLRGQVANGDGNALRATLGQAHQARHSLPSKETASGTLVELSMPIPDHPGVLAEVTTTVGRVGVNIDDLRIEHAPEGGAGTLHLSVTGDEQAELAHSALHRRGYEAMERRP